MENNGGLENSSRFFLRREKVEKTANNLYKAKVNQSKEPAFKQPILNVTLDFLKLEELCKNFKRK